MTKNETQELKNTLIADSVDIELKGKKYKLKQFKIKEFIEYLEKVGEAPDQKAPTSITAFSYKSLFYQIYFCMKKDNPDIAEDQLNEMLPPVSDTGAWTKIAEKVGLLDNLGLRAQLKLGESKNSQGPVKKEAGQE